MPAYEFQCMECKTVFGENLTIEERSKDPKISCPHCGATHVHEIISRYAERTERTC